MQSAYGSIRKLGRGGGGGPRVAAFHMPWEGQPLLPLPPKPGLTGKGGGGPPRNTSLASRQIRAKRGFPHLDIKINFGRGGGGGGGFWATLKPLWIRACCVVGGDEDTVCGGVRVYCVWGERGYCVWGKNYCVGGKRLLCVG